MTQTDHLEPTPPSRVTVGITLVLVLLAALILAPLVESAFERAGGLFIQPIGMERQPDVVINVPPLPTEGATQAVAP